MTREPYSWMEPERQPQPPSELTPAALEEPEAKNAWGAICFRQGAIAVRVQGFTKPVWSVWAGRQLMFTTDDRAQLDGFVKRAMKKTEAKKSQ